MPRQRINYHLRELESAGLLEQVAERRKGNCVERLVRAVARTYVISPEALGTLGEHRGAPDRFSSAYLAGAAARVLRDVGELRARAARAGKPLATLTLESEVAFASAADRAAFAEELTREVARLVAEYHAPAATGARLYRFTLGGYPAITKPEDDPDAHADRGALPTPPQGDEGAGV
jgi:hypothetical protein